MLRKGKVVHEAHRSNIEVAAKHLAFIIDKASDEGKAFFGGIDDICDQEGCSEKATITYALKHEYCDGPGNCGAQKDDKRKEYLGIPIRKFCSNHAVRGDCGIEDADNNYELLEGTPGKVPEKDISPSVFAGTITVTPNYNE